MIAPEEERVLKTHLVEMFGHISSMRREFAALQGDSKGSFATMTDTLDAIVENTEAAGNAILESMEAIGASVAKLQSVNDPAAASVCDEIVDSTNKVFEACAFQDLTGQRITRVIKSLQFMEDHINRLVRMWGKEELARLAAELAVQSGPDLMQGPQRPSVAISQDDIDKLFAWTTSNLMPIAANAQIDVALDQIDRDAEGPEISMEDADSTDMQQGSRD